jgi:cytochrome P450
MPAESKTGDPLRRDAPPALGRAFFDPAQKAWVLSRYRDVLDALREPALRQEGPQKAPPHVRNDVSATLSQSKLAEWEQSVEHVTHRIIASLPPDRPIELVSDFIRPWSLAVTAVVLGLSASHRRQLDAVAPYLNDAGSPAPIRSRRSLKRILLGAQRRIANARLQRLLRSVHVPGAQSLFLGLTQTIPEFLANAWLALLENPTQLQHLRDEPGLIPKAIEELLRYSGPVHTLMRIADRPVDLAGVRVAEGERVVLRMALANRDPEYFTHANALDVARRNGGHVALGAGVHSCVGALLVRMASISATRAFVNRLTNPELVDPVVWRRGSTLASPSVLRVRCDLRM